MSYPLARHFATRVNILSYWPCCMYGICKAATFFHDSCSFCTQFVGKYTGVAREYSSRKGCELFDDHAMWYCRFAIVIGTTQSFVALLQDGILLISLNGDRPYKWPKINGFHWGDFTPKQVECYGPLLLTGFVGPILGSSTLFRVNELTPAQQGKLIWPNYSDSRSR